MPTETDHTDTNPYPGNELSEHVDRFLAWDRINQVLFDDCAPLTETRIAEKCGMGESWVYDIIRNISRKQCQKTSTKL